MPQYPSSRRRRNSVGKIAESKGKKVVYNKRNTSWPIIRTGFKDLKKKDQQRYLSSIKSLSKKFPGEKHRVLDWGCGQGRIVGDLATKFSGIEFIGFSKEAYPADWNIAPKNAKFLHTTKEVLERYLQKEKKKGKPVHLIISNFGLEHISLRDLTSYLKNISPHLPIGAKIITNPLLFSASKNSRQEKLLKQSINELEEAGYELNIFTREKDGPQFLFSLKKVK